MDMRTVIGLVIGIILFVVALVLYVLFSMQI